MQKHILTAIAVLLLAVPASWAEDFNPILGRTRDFVLREADLDRILTSQPAEVQKRIQEDPQQRIRLVRELIIKKAVAEKARKEGFDRKPEIREQLGYVFDSYISQEYLQRVVISGISITEDEAKKFYQEHEKDFVIPEQVKVRHILIAVTKDATAADKEKARVRAEMVLERLKKGEDFAALAKEFSDDQNSSAKGGELAPVSKGLTNSTEFETAALALKKGETSGIVATGYGLHIIRVDDRQEAKQVPFAEVKERIIGHLKAELERKKIQEFVEQTTKDAGVEIAGDKDTTPATPEKKDETAK